jgi:hypothetical protein
MTSDSPRPPTPSEVFYAGAIPRIIRLILWLAVPAAIATGLWMGGWKAAVGTVIGALAGYESFFSLSRGVNALGDRIANAGSTESGKRVIARFVGRYVVVALGAYVIFTVSRIALYGFLIGLCLPVLAMMCEAGYELTVALRRGL